MEKYIRKYPFFSLCGLNCGLCPRYQTDGISKCPGCGGQDFNLKHPSCTIITCNKKHDNVEYCYQCSLYPCERYKKPSSIDSFITYKNVLNDFKKAKQDIEVYKNELNAKIKILEELIGNYNDGRKKNYYCIAVNLFDLNALKKIMERINNEIKEKNIDIKSKIKMVIEIFEVEAKNEKIEIKLRKT